MGGEEAGEGREQEKGTMGIALDDGDGDYLVAENGVGFTLVRWARSLFV